MYKDVEMLPINGIKFSEILQNNIWKNKKAGYKVIDNYDKNLDDKVIITKLDNGIKYSVVDSSGNEATAFRKFKYDDLVKPTISLDGYSTVYLEIGKEYVEKGYTASDNCDGDITSKVKVSNNINVKEVKI